MAYQYCNNSPVMLIDPTGMEGEDSPVIKVPVPSDIKVHANQNGAEIINNAINIIGNNIGYSNLSDKLETNAGSSLEEYLLGDILGKEGANRGITGAKIETEIDGTGYLDDTDAKISVFITGLEIKGIDNNNVSSQNSESKSSQHQISGEGKFSKENKGGVGGNYTYTTGKTYTDTDGKVYNVYTSKINIRIMVKTKDNTDKDVNYYYDTSIMGTVSSMMDLDKAASF